MSLTDLIDVVEKAGYGANEMTEFTHSAEKARRSAAYQAELRLFWISAVLTLPFGVADGRHVCWAS